MTLTELKDLYGTPAFRDLVTTALIKAAQEGYRDVPSTTMISGYESNPAQYVDRYGANADYPYADEAAYNKAVEIFNSQKSIYNSIAEMGSKRNKLIDDAAPFAACVIEDLLNVPAYGLTFPAIPAENGARKTALENFAKALPDALYLEIAKRIISGKSYSPTKVDVT